MGTVILNGAFVGLVYGLLGVGLVVVYRGSRVINFAYGETGMLAAFVFAELRLGNTLASTADRGILFTLPLAVGVAAALGALTEMFVVRPLREAPRVRLMVGTFAVGAMLLTFAIERWGVDVRFNKPLVEGAGADVLGLTVKPDQFVILAVALTVLSGLWALYRYTSFGLRLRATALDPYAAGLVGVNTNRTSMATWAMAGALSGLSAILIAPLVVFNVFFMAALSVRALAAALVGGLTSVGGAFTAGLLLGILEGVISYESPVTGVTDASVALVVIAVLLLRPTGLVRTRY